MSTEGNAAQSRPVVCVSATIKDAVEPDIAEFRIRFEWHGQSQEACTKQYSEDVRCAQDALRKLGLEDELKVSGFTSYANRSRRGRTITGYEYVARGVLRLKRVEHDIPAVWTALAKSGIKATINVYFSLEDEDAEEAKLLGTAVGKARSSAEALAAAAGKRLGDVRQIRYKRYDGAFGAAPGSLPFCARSEAEEDLPDLNPEPIEIECSVDVDWWLG